MTTIDYYMTLNSPWTYLGSARFAAIAVRHKAAINITATLFTDAGVYVVISNANGCWSDSAFATVSIDTCIIIPDPVVPNVFTPNGDGTNDVISLTSSSRDPLVFNIFNRWGQLIFATEGQSIIWNGRTSGNAPLPDGVYYYELLGTRADGSALELKGYLHLIRDR